MSVFLIRPVPFNWQRLRPITDFSVQWRKKNDPCAPAFYSGCKVPLELSHPARLRHPHHPQATWKISNYRRGTGIFEETRGRGTCFDEDDDYDSEDEEDRSLDLLVTVVHNIFKKVSRRARKAARKVLPPAISTQLVGFSVNGVIILSFLWIAKAFLQVVCTFGSVVYVAIFLLRIVWSAITYIKINGNTRRLHGIDDDNSWNSAQPAI